MGETMKTFTQLANQYYYFTKHKMYSCRQLVIDEIRGKLNRLEQEK